MNNLEKLPLEFLVAVSAIVQGAGSYFTIYVPQSFPRGDAANRGTPCAELTLMHIYGASSEG